MAPEQDAQRRAGRKLTKRRKPIRASSVQYPERLKEGEDIQEDVTAVKGRQVQYMNQSVFSMIAAAGSKTDFHARFEEESESEEDEGPSALPSMNVMHSSHKPIKQHLDEQHVQPRGDQAKPSERKGIRSLPKLNLRTPKEKNYISQSIQLPAREDALQRESLKGMTPRDAPVMGKLLEAQADLSTYATSGDEKDSQSSISKKLSHKGQNVNLATRLMEIFGFEKPEEVISGS